LVESAALLLGVHGSPSSRLHRGSVTLVSLCGALSGLLWLDATAEYPRASGWSPHCRFLPANT